MSAEAHHVTAAVLATAPHRRRRHGLLWLVVGVILTATPGRGLDLQQPGAVIHLQQFKTQGRGERGQRWFLEGQSAVIRGTVYELSGVTLRLETGEDRTAVIQAQACTYYQDSGLIESAAPVHVESDGIILDGIGFDMLMAERRLRVREAVRMELVRAGEDLEAVLPTHPAAPAAPAGPDDNAKKQAEGKVAP